MLPKLWEKVFEGRRNSRPLKRSVVFFFLPALLVSTWLLSYTSAKVTQSSCVYHLWWFPFYCYRWSFYSEANQIRWDFLLWAVCSPVLSTCQLSSGRRGTWSSCTVYILAWQLRKGDCSSDDDMGFTCYRASCLIVVGNKHKLIKAKKKNWHLLGIEARVPDLRCGQCSDHCS